MYINIIRDNTFMKKLRELHLVLKYKRCTCTKNKIKNNMLNFNLDVMTRHLQ